MHFTLVRRQTEKPVKKYLSFGAKGYLLELEDSTVIKKVKGMLYG